MPAAVQTYPVSLPLQCEQAGEMFMATTEQDVIEETENCLQDVHSGLFRLHGVHEETVVSWTLTTSQLDANACRMLWQDARRKSNTEMMNAIVRW